jgi:hypothetical protein
LLGLIVTGASLIGAGWVGGLIDEKGRLAFVRWAIGVQKVRLATDPAGSSDDEPPVDQYTAFFRQLSTAIAYAVFIGSNESSFSFKFAI